MGIGETLLLALGLSMDAFTVAVCKGLACHTVRLRQMLATGLWFGSFQALMPLIGFGCGVALRGLISAYDHWIAFILLTFLGGKMLWEAFHQKEQAASNASFAPGEMATMALATSIDALAVGITLPTLGANTYAKAALAAGMIGVITFAICMLGVAIGNRFGTKFKNKASIAGGVVLILVGTKILLEHLGIINF